MHFVYNSKFRRSACDSRNCKVYYRLQHYLEWLHPHVYDNTCAVYQLPLFGACSLYNIYSIIIIFPQTNVFDYFFFKIQELHLLKHYMLAYRQSMGCVLTCLIYYLYYWITNVMDIIII